MGTGPKREHELNAGDDHVSSKRRRASDQPVIPNDQYTVGWICALPLEMAAAKGMLDELHPDPLQRDPGDHNTYRLGEVCGHNVVVACLPAGNFGVTSAATVATHMLRTFKSVRFGLMVGIGGGIPSASHDIRLGDVVVSQPGATNGGVIQYDRGKSLQEQGFERTGMLNAPPRVLLSALGRLQADHLTEDSRIPEFMAALPHKMKKRFSHPGASNDCLYLAEYPHVIDNSSCQWCDPSQIVAREDRDDSDPVIHYGSIASGNQVIKDATLRDQLGKELGVICFEMEAAGLQDFPSIVIRGICDYSDSHKNKAWQFYAATTAAAFAKELLSVIPPSRVLQENPIPELVSNVGDSARCEKNTRVRIQQVIRDWADAADGEPFLWLVGPAGTGKSTLVRSVADSLHEVKKLVAGYFFKRGEQGRNDTNRLFSTLAMQMADNVHGFKASLRASLGNIDKDSIDKMDLGFQFEKLLKVPLEKLPPLDSSQDSRVIVLDALDECERPENLNRILAFISEICNNHKILPLRVLLTSRPVPGVIDALQPLMRDGTTRQLPLNRVFTEDTKTDIRSYLETNFMRIRTKAKIRQDPWPTLAEINHLVELCTQPEPLFIYAATLVRFVYDEKQLQNPKIQLRIWLKQCRDNESQLHQMYNPILEQIFAFGRNEDFDKQLQLLGSLVLSAKPLSLTSLTSLLALDADDVNWWLPGLRAVLDIPSDPSKPIRLLHKSFSDFLFSADNTSHTHFQLDASETHRLLAEKCIELMKKRLKRDICCLHKLDAMVQDVSADTMDRCIPFELEYSCLYWVYHLRAGRNALKDYDMIYAFLLQHFLHWLEVLSILGQVSDGYGDLQYLINIPKQPSGGPFWLNDFLEDATSTILSFASIIESTPLQAYASLLLFSPATSKVRQQFWNQRLPPLSHIEGIKSNWDAHLRTLDVSDAVTGLSFSSDGRFVASAGSQSIKCDVLSQQSVPSGDLSFRHCKGLG
ncbi:hypothetical protein NW752_006964 [Fusarium irregulare]|nr:hypothetical protein NW752_006964 [Fusarium irregulare]